ncbi:TetR/AcrR family transcriptional regulator [Actinomadura sp. 9N407]|uniref:TetR/AcrR family transcriptional regulator n=1 Tax=Actinomadura sp. 9N407 TaxID=3375154 RepID=UPI00378D3E81
MSTRPHRGRGPQERVAERRARLIVAGLDMWGECGWSGVSVRGVCARARLTDRYFYESFDGREALLLAVFDQALADLMAAMAAVPWEGEPRPFMRASMTAVFAALDADPRLARVTRSDTSGSPALERRRHEALDAIADLITARITAVSEGPMDADSVRAPVRFCVAGVLELISMWLGGRLEATVEQLADQCSDLCARVFGIP